MITFSQTVALIVFAYLVIAWSEYRSTLKTCAASGIPCESGAAAFLACIWPAVWLLALMRALFACFVLVVGLLLYRPVILGGVIGFCGAWWLL